MVAMEKPVSMATCLSGILFLRRHSLKVSAKHLRKLHLNPGRRGMAGFHHKPPPDERRNLDWLPDRIISLSAGLNSFSCRLWPPRQCRRLDTRYCCGQDKTCQMTARQFLSKCPVVKHRRKLGRTSATSLKGLKQRRPEQCDDDFTCSPCHQRTGLKVKL